MSPGAALLAPPRRRARRRRGLPPAAGRRARARRRRPAAPRGSCRIDLDGNVTLPIVGALRRRRPHASPRSPPRPATASPPPRCRPWPRARPSRRRSGPPPSRSASASYRPIYVGGEVRAGGAFPFAPGLTARRAIVLAGGPGRMPATPSSAASSSKARSPSSAHSAPPPPRASTACARSSTRRRPRRCPEAERAHPRSGAAARTRRAAAHFATAIRHTRAQIDELTAQLANETEGMAADRDDFERIEDMREAGTATALRLSDARRALLFSTTRQLADRHRARPHHPRARLRRVRGAPPHPRPAPRGPDRGRRRAAQLLAELDAADRRHRTPAGLARRRPTPPPAVSITGSDGDDRRPSPPARTARSAPATW